MINLVNVMWHGCALPLANDVYGGPYWISRNMGSRKAARPASLVKGEMHLERFYVLAIVIVKEGDNFSGR